MHILLIIGSIPVKTITLVLSTFISMENSDAILFKLCTEYCKSSSDLVMSTWSYNKIFPNNKPQKKVISEHGRKWGRDEWRTHWASCTWQCRAGKLLLAGSESISRKQIQIQWSRGLGNRGQRFLQPYMIFNSSLCLFICYLFPAQHQLSHIMNSCHH
jgi:hypothetical protein